jgi:sensor histidine kinase YesM
MDAIHIVVHIISNVFIAAFAIERFMNVFFEEKKTGTLIRVLSYLFYAVATSTLWLLFDTPALNLLCNIAILFLITLNYHSSIIRKLSAVCIIYVFMLIADVLVAILSGHYMVSLFEPFGYDNIFGIVAIPLFFHLEVLLLRNFKNIKKNSPTSIVYWVSSVAIPVSSIFLVTLIITTSNLSQVLIVAAIIVIFGINVLTFYLYDLLSASYAHKLESTLLEQEKEYYYNQCELMRESTDNLHSFKHDIKHHLTATNDYIKQSKSEEASDYLVKLIGEVSVNTSYSTTGNTALDSIINYKLRDIKERGIALNADISFPAKINIEAKDIVTIVGNLLDNAINAVQRVNEKELSLKIAFNKGMVTINIENTYDGKVKYENGEIVSLKKSGHHGWGLKNIQKSLDKYNGFMDISHDDKVFSVDVLLYAKQS